jgi:hypothetical protein
MTMAVTDRAARRKNIIRWVRSSRRRRPSVALALAGALVGAGLYQGNQLYITATSPTSCGAGCVTDGSVPFGSDAEISEMGNVEGDIASANRSARSGGSYVSVVLLDPFTYSTSGTISQQRMTDELRGAYLAQQEANKKGARIKIQLLLANEGTSGEEGEARAVRQIESLETADHIVAVAGMGLSTASTQTAAAAFEANGMPMFGALTTGDEFNSAYYQGFYQVVPDVGAQVQQLFANLKSELTSYGKDHGDTKPQIELVSSNQETDTYSADLQTDFSTAFGSVATLDGNTFDPAMATVTFASIAPTICGPWKGPRVVLYAGREASLPILIQEFQQSNGCQGKKVTIVTGSDANGLRVSATVSQPEIPGGTVTVEYADIEDVAGNALRSFTAGYCSLLQDGKCPSPPDTDRGTPKVGQAAVCLNQVYDPWAVATYNSVMAAVGALQPTQGSPDRQTEAANAMNAVNSKNPIRYTGVSSVKFGFNVNGQLAAADIPVYLETNGTCTRFY